MRKGARWTLNTVYVVLGIVIWFLVTRGWDEYSTLISPISAILIGIAQFLYWTRLAGRRNPDPGD